MMKFNQLFIGLTLLLIGANTSAEMMLCGGLGTDCTISGAFVQQNTEKTRQLVQEIAALKPQLSEKWQQNQANWEQFILQDCAMQWETSYFSFRKLPTLQDDSFPAQYRSCLGEHLTARQQQLQQLLDNLKKKI